MKIKTLCKTDWVSLRKIIDPENGVDGYDYLHEDRCDGKIVSILPYRHFDYDIEYLLRKEVTPCWGMGQKISSITGGVENDDVLGTAVHEVAEEAGYEIQRTDLQFLGVSYGTKSCDTEYYMYAVDLTNKQQTLSADGDGSELERKAECFWTDRIDEAVDPLVYVMHYQINSKIK